MGPWLVLVLAYKPASLTYFCCVLTAVQACLGAVTGPHNSDVSDKSTAEAYVPYSMPAAATAQGIFTSSHLRR